MLSYHIDAALLERQLANASELREDVARQTGGADLSAGPR